MIRALGPLSIIVLFLPSSCSDDGTAPADGGDGGSVIASIEVVEAFPNLTFTRPVDIQNAGDGSNRLFVVEQAGRILVFDNVDTVQTMKTFSDIRNQVNRNPSYNEDGLLSLAFDPDFPTRPYYYLYFTRESPRQTRLSRFEVDPASPDTTVAGSQLVFRNFSQPYHNHNGGQLAFGPDDGFLYLGLGDGGSARDPDNNGQDRSTFLGNILRLDVTTHPYVVPPDNPFVGVTGVLPEIWAYGFRNPWRMSFDPVTGWLWVGDVGQNAWEEVDLVQGGQNYGWRIMEGDSCCTLCEPANQPCDVGGLTRPIWTYANTGGQAVTGGYVYRGSRIPELQGAYIYADYGTGEIWALRYDGINPPVNELVANMSFHISSFGLDEAGELYFCEIDLGGGPSRIFTFERVETPVP